MALVMRRLDECDGAFESGQHDLKAVLLDDGV